MNAPDDQTPKRERRDGAPLRPPLAGPGARLIRENVRERDFDVDANFDGWRLDRFLANRLGRLSRDRANAIARHGDVELRPPRGRIKPARRLRRGDVVTLREHMNPEWIQDDQVDVLWTDEALLILDKPAGMLVHESASVRLNTAQGYLERAGWDGAEPIHRIDRETSGVLVCARRPELVPGLRERFATDHPDKIYRAIALDARGRWRPGQEEALEVPLGLISSERLELRMGPGELPCYTHVRALAERELPGFGRAVDLQVRIETGRQHQIRAHLALESTPIAGDKLYGQDDAFFIALCDDPADPELLARLPYPRHALHAWRVRMEHPRSRAAMRWEAPLPPEIWPPE